MTKYDKTVKEVSAASIQKDLLTLEEQEVCMYVCIMLAGCVQHTCTYIVDMCRYIAILLNLLCNLVWPAH